MQNAMLPVEPQQSEVLHALQINMGKTYTTHTSSVERSIAALVPPKNPYNTLNPKPRLMSHAASRRRAAAVSGKMKDSTYCRTH